MVCYKGYPAMANLCFVTVHVVNVQFNLSKPNTLGTKEEVWFRENSGFLEVLYIYSKYREQDLKTHPV
jgi:hypothetical protein